MQYKQRAPSNQESPASSAYEITPSNTVEIGPYVPRGIYVGVGGNITAELIGDKDAPVLFLDVPTGTVLPIRARLIHATGTTATNLVALY